MSLAEKIAVRNDEAITTTYKILSDYSIVLDEVFKDMCRDEMTVQWLNIDFHQNTNALVDVIGVAKYKIGSIMNVDGGDVVYIDETNVDNYATKIRVILPIMLLDDADVDELIVFVKEYSELVLSSSQDEMDLMVADKQFLKKCFKCFKDGVPPLPKPKQHDKQPRIEYEGFDLTDMGLDDIQLSQLLTLKPEGQS